MRTGMCYWRFKGDRAWKFGYCTHVQGQLYRMGFWNGDTTNGPIVEAFDVETQEYMG